MTMREKDEDELILRLTIEHLVKEADWPRLVDIHRRIHREIGEEVDVRAAAERLAPHPFFSRYSDLSEQFAPPLWVLAQLEAATELVDGVLIFIDHARTKYLTSTGHTEVRDSELVALGVSPQVAAALRRLIEGVPWLTAGGGSNNEGWYVTVSDDIVRWKDVTSRAELVDRLQKIEEQRNAEYAAMARAKQRLVDGDAGSHEPGGYESGRSEIDIGPVHLHATPHYEVMALSLGTGIDVLAKSEDFPPRRSGMPDLSNLYATNVLPMILNMTFRGMAPTSHPALAYTSGFVRLVDKAVREYELARLAFEQYLASGADTLSPYFKAADHLENCLGSARRAIRYARRIRRDPSAAGIDKQDMPTEADERRVARFRNAAEHADEQVADGTLQAGDPIITMMHDTTFVLGAAEESYEWLAHLLGKLHVLATRVVELRPGSDDA